MTRWPCEPRPQDRLDDIAAAVERCRVYAQRLDSPDLAPMAYDAILRNLAVIGEAAKALPPSVREEIPDVPWPAIMGLRDVVVHEYFRVDEAVIRDVVDTHLSLLGRRLRER